MLGFYVTDTGRDKIANAVQSGTRVAITKCALGDSGDKTGEIDYAKTALTNQVYSKTLDSTDSYSVKGNKLLIKVLIPDDAGELTFNEVGFLDDADSLIIYGVTGTVHKLPGGPDSPQVIELDNYIQLDQKQLDSLKISADNYGDRLDTLEVLTKNIDGRVGTLEGSSGNLTSKVKALEDKNAALEPRVKANEDNKVDKISGKGLSTNDFTTAYKNQIDNNKTSISNLDTNKVDKISGKGLSTNDFTTAYKNQIDTNKTNISNKVDKVSGKGLSTYDFTSSYRTQIDTNKSNISSLTSRVGTVEDQLSGVAAALEELI